MIETVNRMDLFFKNQLERVLAKERLELSEHARAHIEDVLLWAASHGETAAHDLMEALGPQFIKAMRSPGYELLEKVGDQALLLRGVWWQYVERKYSHGVSASYYEDIGQRAYLLIRRAHFNELGEKFVPLTRILALMWSDTLLNNKDEIVALYRFWVHTRSPLAKKILERNGIRVNQCSVGQ